ncbi:cell wall elongation regulator TseB-like domain-containing protein [Paenibacillus nasutitermitis]|uniref:Cell wall elongation regulator TseB-like domain-containing protein n=1 Tax=Paenibacillus nasutitermitis TaxID=1652958 RepID=A0A917DUP6_9BACL|nr:DUF5590 domain-containing protein [Paenibacillus nasutitermitis]GGD68905.1 hypothetical protein GCM10010911_28370 [Paenibacillus nasutitermitis]
MTRTMWLLLGAIVVMLILIGLNLYYRSVQSTLWKEEHSAEVLAVQTGGLKEATKSHRFVWDEPVWIVEGKDQDGDDAYVWMVKEPLKLKAKNGVTESEIKSKFRKKSPAADLYHIKLGMLDGAPVWEVFYADKNSSKTFNYYDFYKYGDGSFIITYTLSTN